MIIFVLSNTQRLIATHIFNQYLQLLLNVTQKNNISNVFQIEPILIIGDHEDSSRPVLPICFKMHLLTLPAKSNT